MLILPLSMILQLDFRNVPVAWQNLAQRNEEKSVDIDHNIYIYMCECVFSLLFGNRK
jgi:hypothetical protein